MAYGKLDLLLRFCFCFGKSESSLCEMLSGQYYGEFSLIPCDALGRTTAFVKNSVPGIPRAAEFYGLYVLFLSAATL